VRRRRLAIVGSSHGYRLADYLTAAAAMGVDVVVATDAAPPMARIGSNTTVRVDFARPEWSARRIASTRPWPDAIVAIDDAGVVTAAAAAERLDLPHNPVPAVSATRDKALLRTLLARADVPQPRFRIAPAGKAAVAADALGVPVVVKPRRLSAGRGVIRADDRPGAEAAEARIRALLGAIGHDPDEALVVESFVPGPEVSVDGILSGGKLEVLAIMDKPGQTDGPFFEETYLVTPSRLDPDTQRSIISTTEAAVDAVGLREGPIHGELRVPDTGPVVIELAARPIGGLCGRALTFGLLGETLEGVIIRSALGLPRSGSRPSAPAAGVLMVPVPEPGVLVGFERIDAVLATDGITAFEPTVAPGTPVAPLPEGDRYLAFLFATGATAEDVEAALRTGASLLDVRIERDTAAATPSACR